MIKINYKKNLLYILLIVFIFALDRFSKLYILSLASSDKLVNVYINPFFNLYLIWNKGIAFGLFSFEEDLIYNFITILIIIITSIIIWMIVKCNDFRIYFLIFILGGSFGNLFDRLYYSAVPDFIDLHINNFHWFIFNVADIFISLGVIGLIFFEIFDKKNT